MFYYCGLKVYIMETDYKNGYVLGLNCKGMREQQNDQLDAAVKLGNTVK